MSISQRPSKIRNHILHGSVDPRTLRPTGKAIVDQYRNHPELQDELERSVLETLEEHSSLTLQQLENVAYLGVNLGSALILSSLVERVRTLDEPSEDASRLAIAAVRSFPDASKVFDKVEPDLRSWMRDRALAGIAFEALSELNPQNSVSYLLELWQLHPDQDALRQSTLAHYYFLNGDAEKEPRIQALASVIESAILAISSSDILPSILVEAARRRWLSALPGQGLEVKAFGYSNLTHEFKEQGGGIADYLLSPLGDDAESGTTYFIDLTGKSLVVRPGLDSGIESNQFVALMPTYHQSGSTDFISRYLEGDPSEGFDQDEAVTVLKRVARNASPEQMERATRQALEKMNPGQRSDFAKMLQQRHAGEGVVPIERAGGGTTGGGAGGSEMGVDDILGDLLDGASGGRGFGGLLGGLLGGSSSLGSGVGVDIDSLPIVTGTVKHFDPEKGFGFITQDAGDGDVFFHHSAVGYEDLNPGDHVEFTLGTVGGLGDLLSSPAGKALIGGIAAYGMKEIMDGKK